MTRIPTSMSATARDIKKKFVAFWSFFSKDTAIITSMFPPMVRIMMIKIIKAGQFFSFIDDREMLSESERFRVSAVDKELFTCQAIWPPCSPTFRLTVVKLIDMPVPLGLLII